MGFFFYVANLLRVIIRPGGEDTSSSTAHIYMCVCVCVYIIIYVHCTQPHTRTQHWPKAESIFYNFLAPPIFDEINMDYVQAVRSPSPIRGDRKGEREKSDRERERERDRKNIYVDRERKTYGLTKRTRRRGRVRAKKMSILLAAKIS
jgi:hypothetical protein